MKASWITSTFAGESALQVQSAAKPVYELLPHSSVGEIDTGLRAWAAQVSDRIHVEKVGDTVRGGLSWLDS